MKRRPRILLILLLLLLAGAIVNVAVAWGCLFFPLHSSPPAFGMTEMDWKAVEALGYERKPKESTDAWVREWGGFAVRGHETWYRVKLTQSQVMNGLMVSPTARVASGWPLPCLRGERIMRSAVAEGWVEPSPLVYEHVGSRIWMVTVDGRMHAAFVPRLPIWPGFAINTVFYAVILWLLFAAPFALRRRRRNKRGLCVNCAYPVGTSDVCTECGAAVQPRPARGDGM